MVIVACIHETEEAMTWIDLRHVLVYVQVGSAQAGPLAPYQTSVEISNLFSVAKCCRERLADISGTNACR